MSLLEVEDLTKRFGGLVAVNAVSFEVMRRERITHALTFDRHFSLAGYEILE